MNPSTEDFAAEILERDPPTFGYGAASSSPVHGRLRGRLSDCRFAGFGRAQRHLCLFVCRCCLSTELFG